LKQIYIICATASVVYSPAPHTCFSTFWIIIKE